MTLMNYIRSIAAINKYNTILHCVFLANFTLDLHGVSKTFYKRFSPWFANYKCTGSTKFLPLIVAFLNAYVSNFNLTKSPLLRGRKLFYILLKYHYNIYLIFNMKKNFSILYRDGFVKMFKLRYYYFVLFTVSCMRETLTCQTCKYFS